MFYFCGKHFIAFKIVASDYSESVNEDAVLFIFKDGNKLLLSVQELDEIIDTSIESCRKQLEREHYMVLNLLSNKEEEIVIDMSVVLYSAGVWNLSELRDLREYFSWSDGFEFNLLHYALYGIKHDVCITLKNNAINIMTKDEQLAQYINKFYFDLVKIKMYDTLGRTGGDLSFLDIGGV